MIVFMYENVYVLILVGFGDMFVLEFMYIWDVKIKEFKWKFMEGLERCGKNICVWIKVEFMLIDINLFIGKWSWVIVEWCD